MDPRFGLGKKMMREVRPDEAGAAEDHNRTEVAQLTVAVRLPFTRNCGYAVAVSEFVGHVGKKNCLVLTRIPLERDGTREVAASLRQVMSIEHDGDILNFCKSATMRAYPVAKCYF